MSNLLERIKTAKTVAELVALEKSVCNNCTCKHLGYHLECDDGHVCKFEQMVADKKKALAN